MLLPTVSHAVEGFETWWCCEQRCTLSERYEIFLSCITASSGEFPFLSGVLSVAYNTTSWFLGELYLIMKQRLQA